MRTLILVIALSSGVLAQSPPAGSLDAARDLYASADYRGALEMLDHLSAANPALHDQQSIDLYRTFCLIALQRMEEADEAIAAMTTRDPLYRPVDGDMPPRLRPLFTDKRRALLPGIIQARYAQAKTAFDRGDYKTSADAFTQILMALADPDIAGEVRHAPLADLRVLAIGFKDLSIRAIAPPAAPVVPPPVPPSPMASAPAPSPAPAPVAEVAHGDAPKPPRIFDSNDGDVMPPITLKQEIPRFQRTVLVERTGVLFIVIDERGIVESAIITEPLDRLYDPMVLAAARTWIYRPATRNGMPVKYRKRIQMTLPRQTN